MIDFPASPTTGQLFNASNGVTYRWNGTVWLSEPSLGTGYGPTGDVSAIGTGIALAANTWTTLGNTTIISGNLGGWLSAGRYTPPAGRYYLSGTFFGYSTAGNMQIIVGFRKNGVRIGAEPVVMAASGSSWEQAFVDVTVDANGSDWFDFQANVSLANTAGGSFFTAFPVVGAKGPPGDKGQPGVPASSNGWRQIARVVPTAGQVNVDLTSIPIDINDLELRFDVTPQTNGAYLYMGLYNGSGVLDTSNSYVSMNQYSYSSAAAASAVVTYPTPSSTVFTFMLNAAANGVSTTYSIQGDVRFNNIRDASRYKYWRSSVVHVEESNNYYYLLNLGGAIAVAMAIGGVRLYWSSGNFKAGGAVTLWGSP